VRIRLRYRSIQIPRFIYWVGKENSNRKMTIAQKISEFSLCYKEAVKIWLFYSDLPEELNKIKSNPLLSMCFFAAMAHERAGRNPNFSKFQRIALKRA